MRRLHSLLAIGALVLISTMAATTAQAAHADNPAPPAFTVTKTMTRDHLVNGADQVVDYTKEDFTKGTERYDVILDNVGVGHSLSEYRQVLTPKGKYVQIGGGGVQDQGFLGALATALWAPIYSKFAKHDMGMMMADANQKDLTILGDMMQSGKVKPVIDRTYKLSEVPEAIRYVEEGHARGKVVITVE